MNPYVRDHLILCMIPSRVEEKMKSNATLCQLQRWCWARASPRWLVELINFHTADDLDAHELLFETWWGILSWNPIHVGVWFLDSFNIWLWEHYNGFKVEHDCGCFIFYFRLCLEFSYSYQLQMSWCYIILY